MQTISPWNASYFPEIFRQPLLYSHARDLVKRLSGTNPWGEVQNLQLAAYSGWGLIDAAGTVASNLKQNVNVQGGIMSSAIINIKVFFNYTVEEMERAKGSNGSPFAGSLMAEKQKYTKEGYQKLTEEYELLTKVKREEVKKAIAESRSFGDLSENSEYDEARNEQAKIETRIKELETLIQNAEVSGDDDFDEDTVGLGSTVKLLNNGVEATYNIVGSNEANPFEFKISDMSVIGKALIGMREGDVVTVEAPGGLVHLTIGKVTRANNG